MSYWGSGPTDNDYAGVGVGAIVQSIRERLFVEAERSVEASNSEQSIVALVCCLRAIDSRFPKDARVGFGPRHLERAEKLFFVWFEKMSSKIPSKDRSKVLAEAEREFRAYREQLALPVATAAGE